MESEWFMLKAYIVKQTTWSCDQRLVGACCGSSQKCWTAVVEDVIKLRKELLKQQTDTKPQRVAAVIIMGANSYGNFNCPH